MKLWVDSINHAPNNDYVWAKDVDAAIELFAQHDHAVEIGMRRGMACFLRRDYGGRSKAYEFANRHDIAEISMSEDFVASDDCTKLLKYLESAGRLTSCSIKTHEARCADYGA